MNVRKALDEPPERFDDWHASVAWDYHGVVTTWKLERAGEVQYLKVRPVGMHPTLADERDRLEWAIDRITVPRVLDYAVEGDHEQLLLAPVRGIDSTHLRDDPKRLVPLLAEALRAFHEIDTSGCPFDFTNDAAIAHVRARVETDRITPGYEWHHEFSHLDGPGALARLEEIRPETEDVVVCHGDYCFPNVMFEDWRVVGYLDVGELGLADRWWDLAVGAWSTTWNVGPGYEELFYASYGVERDPQREEFYRLLYSAAS